MIRRRHPDLLLVATTLSFFCIIFAVLLPRRVRGDAFDDFMEQKRRANNIAGVGVAFYDANRMSQPVVRGYGHVGASPSSSAGVTADTTFMLASTAKVFTSAAVAVLLDRGIIGLDDDICDVLPADWDRVSACRNPRHRNVPVTWRMMSTHRSGLKSDIPGARNNQNDFVYPSYGPTGGYDPFNPADGNPTCPLTDVQGFYRDFLTDKPTTTSVGSSMRLRNGGRLDWWRLSQSKGGAWRNSRPGAQRSYSNLAVGYLAALVELASGQDFASFCRQNLFEPLGMRTTAWFGRDLPPGTSRAIPLEYRRNRNDFLEIGHYCFIDYASGQLHTSARDLAAWSMAMLDLGAPALWSRATGEQVVQCQERNRRGRPVSRCQYALGWGHLSNAEKGRAESWLRSFRDYDWTDGIWHDGAESGIQTNLLILPRAGVFALALTNTDYNGDLAAQKMTAALLDAPLP